MAELIELPRGYQQAGHGIVVEDYTTEPALCRKGVWVGLATYFIETVTLSYEHEPEQLNVFWKLNYDEILYPVTGFFGGGPVLNSPGVHYVWPVGGLQHQISFVSAPGTKPSRVNAQVLFQHVDNPRDTEIHYGPALTFDISGRIVQWPPEKEEEERKCQQRWHDLRVRYVHWRKPKPGEPVMDLSHVRGEAAVRMAAVAEALESFDHETNPEYAEALKADLSAQFERAQPSRLE